MTGGAELSISASTSVGSIDLPVDGVINLGEDIEITFTGETANSASWRCKEGVEMNTACSANYEVLRSVSGSMQYVPADDVPCFLDTIEINGDVPTQLQFHSGSFIGSLAIQGETAAQITTPTQLEDWRSSISRQIVGDSPAIGGSSLLCGGPESCERSCMDICNDLELSEVAGNLDAFWALTPADRDNIIAQTTEELDQVASLRDGPVQAWMDNEAALLGPLAQWQADFEAGIDADTIDNDGATGRGTIHNLQVTTDQLTDWMAGASIGGAADLHQLRNDLTVKEAADTWSWFAGQTMNQALWNLINDKDSLTTAAPVVVADDETVAAGGRKARQAPMDGSMGDGSSMGAGDMGATALAQAQSPPNNAAQTVNPFIFMDANAILGRYEISAGETWNIESTHWGGNVPEDAAIHFDAANGAFEWHGLVITGCRIYTDEAGQHRPLVAPVVLEAILSATMTKMSLYQRELYLRGVVHNMPTTTTTLPALDSASESSDEADSGMMLIIIIAAVAVLFIIIIIVVVSKKGAKEEGVKKDEGRGVVSFENPMYDDPKAGGGAASSGGEAGLYDEPSFEAEGKANPMYGSSENTAADGGGYLDVEPDDEGDEDEDEDGEDE